MKTANETSSDECLALLLTRQSNPNLIAPAPSHDDLSKILQAGMRVPDHAGLMPWHFTVVANEGLNKLSDIFAQTVDTQDTVKFEKTKKMPFRAPLIIIISTQYKEHEKVPKQEQLITAGCCAHSMQMAAFGLNYGAIWRTGTLAYNCSVKESLGILPTNDIVGFLYIGTPSKQLPCKRTKNIDDKVSYL